MKSDWFGIFIESIDESIDPIDSLISLILVVPLNPSISLTDSIDFIRFVDFPCFLFDFADVVGDSRFYCSTDFCCLDSPSSVTVALEPTAQTPVENNKYMKIRIAV